MRSKRSSAGAQPAIVDSSDGRPRATGIVSGLMAGISSGITLVAPPRKRARRSWIWLVLLITAAALAGVAMTQLLGLTIEI